MNEFQDFEGDFTGRCESDALLRGDFIWPGIDQWLPEMGE